MILEEFDQATEAIINPWDMVEKQPGFPKVGVSCFARVTFDRMLRELGGQVIAESRVANMIIPIYQAEYRGMKLALFMADVGAPACVGLLEDVFEMGLEKLVLLAPAACWMPELGTAQSLFPIGRCGTRVQAITMRRLRRK